MVRRWGAVACTSWGSSWAASWAFPRYTRTFATLYDLYVAFTQDGFLPITTIRVWSIGITLNHVDNFHFSTHASDLMITFSDQLFCVAVNPWTNSFLSQPTRISMLKMTKNPRRIENSGDLNFLPFKLLADILSTQMRQYVMVNKP